jgi:hypothetical protein
MQHARSGASALVPGRLPKRRILTNQRRSEEHICDRSRVHTGAVESKTLLKSVTALPGVMNIRIASSDRYHGSRYPPTRLPKARLPKATQPHHALEPLAPIGTDAPSKAGETPNSFGVGLSFNRRVLLPIHFLCAIGGNTYTSGWDDCTGGHR